MIGMGFVKISNLKKYWHKTSKLFSTRKLQTVCPISDLQK